MKYIKRRKKRKGFTLMELLVSLGIVAALSMMVAPMIMGKIDEAKEKADISNANAIAVAVQSEMLSGESLTGQLTEVQLKSLADEYFSGKLPTPQSTGEAFAVSVNSNKVIITVGSTQFYPVNESTLPSASK
ncbi:MAG: prepilin-type N-terminal cleavage/methylation domain-containing protein [Clostridium sp.]|uniref:prepilin-type N-terminal cleavage/methylation domain-containing protein n=1 Tax=Clostridium culturomicium TaxID=1499683 RepID=UPI0006944B8B|nr:prepilin-type N-terminal cleavage/methylation domain-containing protein [Clostridium culturomicium]MDU4891308.1 prepilin-type N-terminal cleavage/methylation domain-containing protein [Clostridium sp.]MDU7085132.1 prepilin-type N-terminal cleavage/methylation domain-containing protein [Clostridium sp.]